MTDLVRLLHEFPFFGAFIGAAVGLAGSVGFFFIFGRRINPMYANIVKDLGEAEKVLIESHKNTLEMQKDHDSGIERRTEKIIQPVKDMCGKVVEALEELKR